MTIPSNDRHEHYDEPVTYSVTETLALLDKSCITMEEDEFPTINIDGQVMDIGTTDLFYDEWQYFNVRSISTEDIRTKLIKKVLYGARVISHETGSVFAVVDRAI